MRNNAPSDDRYLNISIAPERLLRWLMIWIVALVAASFAAQALIGMLDAERHRPLVRLAQKFVLDSEVNLPTYYSSGALLACAVLLAVIAWSRHQNHSRHRWHWTGLSALFLLMSFDEIASLHEMSTGTLRRTLDVGGLLYFTWVIPGAAFVALFITIYASFLYRLDRRTRYLFVVAGGTFVAGALGLELVGGSLVERFGVDDIRYYWVATVEEFLEMTGVAIFLFALLEYLGRHNSRFAFLVEDAA